MFEIFSIKNAYIYIYYFIQTNIKHFKTKFHLKLINSLL